MISETTSDALNSTTSTSIELNKDNPNEFDSLYDSRAANEERRGGGGNSGEYTEELQTDSDQQESSASFTMSWARIKSSMKQRIRWIIFGLTWLQLGSVMNCVDVFSFSMVYMETNVTNESADNMYIYSLEEKSSLISAMAIGSLIGMYPQNVLMQKYGARPVLTIASVLCAIVTAFMPWALDTNYHVALVFRIFQGILYSADFGVVGFVCSKWSPLSEVGLSLATLSGFTACRAVIQLPIAGWTVAFFGWRVIYYILSAILLLSTICWFWIYRDDPECHHLITNSELHKILNGRRKENRKISVPYKQIMSEKSVWAVWFAGFADIFASFVFLVYGAQYYQYLGLNAQANAWFNSVKGLLFILVRIMAGLASDRAKCLNEKSKLRLFNTVSLQIPAFILIIVTFLPRNLPYLHIMCITVYQASFGFNCGGFYKAAALISRQFSYFVIGYIQLFKSLATLIEPVLFSLLVLQPSTESDLSWGSYFMFHAIVLTIANTFFIFFVKSEPAEFVMNADLEMNKACGVVDGE
ncbi:unnamed protein product [Caenorhabditis angaria]|uniref:Major facilitator superfamily (MFS) profile domain-containing protein n=1 Tax=Caenorhabditis angaria TaxID=860376 RepID=A0A9P1IUQ1_9PELO|nr:unnamed protein product [Caenorhabditis angaria]